MSDHFHHTVLALKKTSAETNQKLVRSDVLFNSAYAATKPEMLEVKAACYRDTELTRTIPSLILTQTRRAMYVQRNTEARSCNHCCSGKATSITYEGWNFNFGNTPLDWIQELLE